MTTDLHARIDALRREGRYAEAARLCLEHGDPRGASELHAAVWDWEAAIRTAEEAGLRTVAYGYALEADDRRAAARLLEALAERPDEALEAAAVAERRDRPLDAGRLREAAGDVEGAAVLYERAGELFDAARCREGQGRYREAGVLYERRVREAPDDGEAALRLGRILAHFGRWEHAVRALQAAADDPDRRGAALRLMVACFSAMGMHSAAASRLDELRRADPSLPVTVPEFLEERFGDERGIAGLAAEGEGDRSLLLAGRYRIVRPLGAGATGRVLLAHDGFYDRDVAVKVLTVGSGNAGRDAYVRFAREARVAAGVDHPNVVRVHEFNPEGPFLVMEHMAGGTLEDRLVRGERSLALPTIRHVVDSVLAGLEAVHRRGVVHRDLKPANVFFGAAGEVKIGDFGVAHLADLGATLTGAMLGTLAYMAPEQITGSQRPEAATDLYALGVILHRMLTGRLPFPGPDFVTQHLQGDPPPPSAVSPDLGDAYDALLASLLRKDPAHRPRTSAEVRARIAELTWIEPVEGAVEVATGVGARPSSERPPSPADVGADRYEPLEPLGGGAWVARDRLLARLVRIEPCDEQRATELRRWAACDSPWVQAIYEADPALGRAVLEHPAGRLWSNVSVSAARRSRALADLRRGLGHVHAAGLAHGAVGPEAVRLGEGRAVLLLPPAGADPAAATASLDRRALEAMSAGDDGR